MGWKQDRWFRHCLAEQGRRYRIGPLRRFWGTTKHPWLIRQGEHVVRIEGSLDGKEDKLSLRVYTIQFFTEKSSSPLYPIGKKSKDHKFYFECPDGAQITGFFGWADEELDSVGVHMAPI